jgi:hypothetical protein
MKLGELVLFAAVGAAVYYFVFYERVGNTCVDSQGNAGTWQQGTFVAGAVNSPVCVAKGTLLAV